MNATQPPDTGRSVDADGEQPKRVFRVDASLMRQLEATLEQPAKFRSELADLFSRPRPE